MNSVVAENSSGGNATEQNNITNESLEVKVWPPENQESSVANSSQDSNRGQSSKGNGTEVSSLTSYEGEKALAEMNHHAGEYDSEDQSGSYPSSPYLQYQMHLQYPMQQYYAEYPMVPAGYPVHNGIPQQSPPYSPQQMPMYYAPTSPAMYVPRPGGIPVPAHPGAYYYYPTGAPYPPHHPNHLSPTLSAVSSTSSSPLMQPLSPTLTSTGRSSRHGSQGKRFGSQYESVYSSTKTTNIYIKGLTQDTTDDTLYDMCMSYGNIVSSKAIIDQKTGTCKGYGFVMYEDSDQSKAAIDDLNSKGYQVSFAKVMTHKSPQESFSTRLKNLQDVHSTNIYMSNLPLDMSESQLEELFHPYSIISNRILRDQSGVSRGVGFARMSDRDAAVSIIQKYNGVVLPGAHLPLQVRFADSMAQKKLKGQTTKKRVWARGEFSGMSGPPSPLTPEHLLAMGSPSGGLDVSQLPPQPGQMMAGYFHEVGPERYPQGMMPQYGQHPTPPHYLPGFQPRMGYYPVQAAMYGEDNGGGMPGAVALHPEDQRPADEIVEGMEKMKVREDGAKE
ncbi:hypothetical protein K7432_010823 [Basidiobolus ranarum]|uniref:RRM domain-containing protein n=1 Tax=Basidiobolus ranarum TaxID=34480 RepID=A0ABR2WN73_9FUNG